MRGTGARGHGGTGLFSRAPVPLCLCAAFIVACRSEEAPRQGGASVQGPVATGIVLAGGVAPRPLDMDTVAAPGRADSATAASGRGIFLQMNCDGCHGDPPTGFAGPSLVDGRWRHGGSDGEIFQSIYYGRPRGMPAYGGVMDAGTIWRVIAWIKSQPVPANVPTQSWVAGDR